jgi:hypothetical protein
MSGEKPDLTSLESRKQLLILESELNRSLLLNEVRELKGEFHKVTVQARGMGAMVSSVADLAGALSSVGHALAPKLKNGGKPSWISTIVNGARAGASLWQAFRSMQSKS